MDHHHTIVGFTFLYLGAEIVTWMSPIVFEKDQEAFLTPEDSSEIKKHKVYVCSVFAIIFGLIQLVTSAFLTVKEKFLTIWSFIHIGLALAYMIMFIILIVNVEDEVDDDRFGRFRRVFFDEDYGLYGEGDRFFAVYLCQNFLFIVPVAAFNLIYKRMTQTQAPQPVGFTNPPNIPFGQFGVPVVQAQAPSVNFNPMPNAAGIPYTPSYKPQPYPTSYPATNIPLNESARPSDNSGQP